MENNEISGTLLNDLTCIGQRFEQGTVFNYHVYLSPTALEAKPGTLALYLLLEYSPELMAPMLAQFMKEGLIPPGMVVFSYPGTLKATLPGGADRGMRAEEYDQFGKNFSDFLVEELIPAAEAAAKVKLDPSPDMHFITGGSSGGMIAWNGVWFRNDYFRRCFLSSPTFSAIRGGEEAMVLVRKTESRPIRIYMTAGTEEPDYYFGSSLYAALNAASAFEFAGYDFRFELFKGEGHCCFRGDVTLWRRICMFLWANWKTAPVATLTNQIRIRNLIEDGSRWEKTDVPIPSKKDVVTSFGTITYADDKIHLEKDGVKKIAASGFGHITGIRISSDQWRIYVADRDRRFIYAMSIMPDGTLSQKYELAPLHLAHDCRVIGAMDMEILADDRVLVATELGIQGVVTFGLTDLILPLPGDVPADHVAVEGNMLYASSSGTVFRRKLKIGEQTSDGPIAPTSPGYGDNFPYCRSHVTPAF